MGVSNGKELDQYAGLEDGDIHVQKRTRSAEWQSHESLDRESDQPPDSLDNEEYHVNLGRPSRFLEGSMNDRVSSRLPSLYIQDERAMDRYHNAETRDQPGRLIHHPNDSISHVSASNGSTKSSGFFRFGKAFASAFNPANIWQGLNGRSREKQEPVGNSETAIRKERQVQAEKAYAELKQGGFKGTKGVIQARHSSDSAHTKSEHGTQDHKSSHQRDSGIDVDNDRFSGELGANDGISASNDYLLPPPPIPGFGRAASPGLNVNSGKRPPTHLRSPSLQSLKKAISQVHLPSAKRQSDSLAPPLALAHNASMRDVTDQKALKSQLSRKDLEKQEKLGKKVNDLEAKLNSARRELEHAMGNDTLCRHPQYPGVPFVSGELPYASSEHLLNHKGRDHQAQEHDLNKPQTEAVRDLDAALASSKARASQRDHKPGKATVEPKTTFAGRAAAKAEQQKKTDTKKPITKKRKSSGEAEIDVNYKPGSDYDDDAEWEAAKAAPVNRSGRSRKSQKIEKEEVLVHHDQETVEKTQPTSEPEQTTAAQVELQRIRKTFKPEAVNKNKIMSMRSKGNTDVPFGQLTEDIVNLRKEYPSVTDEEIVSYIATVLNEHKRAEKEETHNSTVRAPLDPLIEEKENPGIADGKLGGQQLTSPRRLRKTYSEKTLTKHTSVAHLNEPPPTFLGRPRSASPLKRDTKVSPRLFSPPPSADYSKPASPSETVDDAIRVSPARDGSIPPIPKIPHELEGHVKPVEPGVVSAEVMSKEREDYEWPEDVF